MQYYTLRAKKREKSKKPSFLSCTQIKSLHFFRLVEYIFMRPSKSRETTINQAKTDFKIFERLWIFSQI